MFRLAIGLTSAWLLGLVSGYVSSDLRHTKDGDRIEALAKSMELCDSQVLKAQKELEDARDAFFAALH